jgi:hypothetical protein
MLANSIAWYHNSVLGLGTHDTASDVGVWLKGSTASLHAIVKHNSTHLAMQ